MPYRSLTLLALTAVLLTASAVAAEPAPRQVVAAYLDLWSTGELEALETVVTEDFRRHARPGESPRSAAELADLIRSIRANFDDPVRIDRDEILCEGERCAMNGRFLARIQGTNRGVRMRMVAFYRLQDGRVAEEWVVANQLPSMLGLGYGLVPPQYEIRGDGGDVGGGSVLLGGDAGDGETDEAHDGEGDGR